MISGYVTKKIICNTYDATGNTLQQNIPLHLLIVWKENGYLNVLQWGIFSPTR
jgi:hypothetical protein